MRSIIGLLSPLIPALAIPMPPESKTYQSLSAQVAMRITEEIHRNTWIHLLPSERKLSDTLQVSRRTLRMALAQLQQDGVIEAPDRLGHRIKAKEPRTKGGDVSVGLLTSESLEQLPSYTALWVDELRAMLFERGMRLATFSGRSFFAWRPEEALMQLVKQNPHKCWILTHSNERMQRWLLEQQIPTLIAGSCYRGLQLPNIDIDYFAVCRHAAGVMLRHGHRRCALLIHQSQRAGDVESEAGFIDGVRASPHPDAEPLVTRHDGTIAGVLRTLAGLFDRPRPPSALLISRPTLYLTAFAFLAQRGLRVPHDVSLISRDNDTFLPCLTPTPACYALNPKTYAKRLFSLVLTLIRGNTIAHPQQRIQPRFIPGPSLGPPRPLA